MKIGAYKASHKRTERDLFWYYPYKKRTPGVQQGRNYMPKEELVEDHKHSLTIGEYKEIVFCLTEVMAERLIKGAKITLPYRTGRMFMGRYKVKNPKPWEDYSFTNNYKAYIKWTDSRMYLKRVLRFYWSKTFKKKFREEIFKDFTLINHYPLV